MNVKTVSFRSPTAAKEFTASLLETGFAVIKDHPIDQRLISDTFRDWEDFFASSEKHQHTFDPATQSGYFPFRTENAKDAKQKDLKEFFHLYPKTQLPKKMSDNTLKLYRAMSDLGSTLLSWIEDNTPDEVKARFSMPLRDMIIDSTETLMRPIHYPPLTGVEEEGAVRAAAHEDINLITLLPAATAPGLEVRDLKGAWHSVSCDRGNIAINSGDMLREASGGYFPSTTHRVVNPSGPEAKLPRYSMPLFLHPRREVRLSARHTAGSYLDERLKEIGLKK